MRAIGIALLASPFVAFFGGLIIFGPSDARWGVVLGVLATAVFVVGVMLIVGAEERDS